MVWSSTKCVLSLTRPAPSLREMCGVSFSYAQNLTGYVLSNFGVFAEFCGVLRSFYIMVQSSIKCVLSLTRHAPSL